MATAPSPSPSYETIRVHRLDDVVRIDLHRPDTLNAVNVQLARELNDELESIAGDRTVGSVVLTGAGRAFSSGFDLKDGGLPLRESGRPDTGWGLRNVFHPLVLTLREMPQPVVAAVNGVAAGIGCSYALACDIVLAARSASFLLAFVNVGLVPDGGATVLVPARAGVGRGLEMSLLGEKVSAEEALGWGLVNRVEDDASLLPAATEIAKRLAAGPPQAQADIKRILNAPYLGQLKAALELEAETQSRRSDSHEAAEAIQAFLEKRRPQYRSP